MNRGAKNDIAWAVIKAVFVIGLAVLLIRTFGVPK